MSRFIGIETTMIRFILANGFSKRFNQFVYFQLGLFGYGKITKWFFIPSSVRLFKYGNWFGSD